MLSKATLALEQRIQMCHGREQSATQTETSMRHSKKKSGTGLRGADDQCYANLFFFFQQNQRKASRSACAGNMQVRCLGVIKVVVTTSEVTNIVLPFENNVESAEGRIIVQIGHSCRGTDKGARQRD